MDDGHLFANSSQLSLAFDEAEEVRQFPKARDITLQAKRLLEKAKAILLDPGLDCSSANTAMRIPARLPL
jgi:hypothetical protein